MASASEIYRRLESVNKITVLRDMVYDEIKDKEYMLRDLKEEEFQMGDIYSNGTKAYYSDKSSYQDNREAGFSKYKDYKHALNPIAGDGVVDLMNKGRFINSFKLNMPKMNKYTFGATDSKKNMLVKKYGDIMGLNQQTFEDFQVVIIKPLFIEKLKSIINKK